MKRLLGLCLASAIGALAVMPTAAQAEPHFYKNGVLLEEGELGDTGSSGLEVIGWGTLLGVNYPAGGAVKCEHVFAGDVKNPVGGGAGQAAVDSFTPYDCTSAVCESAGGHWEVIPLGLEKFEEWTAVLEEKVAGVIRMHVGNKEEASQTKIRMKMICAAQGYNVEFHGELSPKILKGTEIGIAPSKLEFKDEEPESSGILESAGAETWHVGGKMKIMGFEGQELLMVKNP